MPTATRFPDFVSIGAQKAGTTWLYQNLATHPDVWISPFKELHYFDRLYMDSHRQVADERRGMLARLSQSDDPQQRARADRRRALAGPMTDEWYGSMFASAPASSLCGEITPAYALLPPEGVDHLLNLSPGVRILFLLRDPIERAWSQIKMHARTSMPLPAASPHLETGIDSNVLARSRYSVTLRTYRARIDEDRLWIGDYDELLDAPASLLRSACAFLGLDFDDRHFPHLHERFHVGRTQPADDAIYQHLRAALEPEYDALVDALPDLARQWRARHYV